MKKKRILFGEKSKRKFWGKKFKEEEKKAKREYILGGEQNEKKLENKRVKKKKNL